jgi:hypothetical protein
MGWRGEGGEGKACSLNFLEVLDLIQKIQPGTRIFFTAHSEEQLQIRAA